MARLILSDGTTFEGQAFGAPVDRDGEVVFNTGMVGYPESLSDPSYHGQILVFTYPLIGNYGIPSEELNAWGFSKNFESENVWPAGVIVNQVSDHVSHFMAEQSLSEWLRKHKVPAITGIDTRMLTKKLREHGVMLGRIAQGDSASDKGQGTSDNAGGKIDIADPNRRNLVSEVSCRGVHVYEPASDKRLATGDQCPTIIAFDCGMKRNILRSFLKRGVRVVRVPWDFDLDRYDGDYDGVFVSNGPGDPKMCTATITQMKKAMDRGIVTFGICLGNQLMALAIGGDTYKLKYGHRGANQPCLDHGDSRLATHDQKKNSSILNSHRCIITSQNHGFAVDGKSLPKGWSVWFSNANDGSVEGIRHESGKFFAVQFHPESTPGPEDANYLFDEFISVMCNKGK
jgi:carbamoyl-phosphate synthase small subunit